MISLFVAIAIGSCVVLLLLAYRNTPPSTDEWDRLLTEEAKRLLDSMSMQGQSDGAMAADALSRAMEAKSGMAFGEAIRLVDLSCAVLEEAAQDRMSRLKSMALAIRMASAIHPVPGTPLAAPRLWEVRSLLAFGSLLHHMLMTAAERFLLRVVVLRYAYYLAARAMKGGAAKIHEDPSALAAWARCDAAVKDVMVSLDPAHLEAYRVLLASIAGRERAA